MKSKKELFENILVETQNVPWLNPLWSVIYHEAIRGNHLLFLKSDVAEFERSETKTENMSDSASEALESVTFALLCCSDLSGMIEIIENQNHQTKLNLYSLYQRILCAFKSKFKTAMN